MPPLEKAASDAPIPYSIAQFYQKVESFPDLIIFLDLGQSAIKSSTGQWSEPMISVWMAASSNLSFRHSDTRK